MRLFTLVTTSLFLAAGCGEAPAAVSLGEVEAVSLDLGDALVSAARYANGEIAAELVSTKTQELDAVASWDSDSRRLSADTPLGHYEVHTDSSLDVEMTAGLLYSLWAQGDGGDYYMFENIRYRCAWVMADLMEGTPGYWECLPGY